MLKKNVNKYDRMNNKEISHKKLVNYIKLYWNRVINEISFKKNKIEL